jgi:hypothetical protein
VPFATGNENDSLIAFKDGKMINLVVPYPMGFFAKGMDGRIDDPNGGWEGRGMWATSGNRTRSIWKARTRSRIDLVARISLSILTELHTCRLRRASSPPLPRERGRGAPSLGRARPGALPAQSVALTCPQTTTADRRYCSATYTPTT